MQFQPAFGGTTEQKIVNDFLSDCADAVRRIHFFQKISTHLLARLGWFCPVVSEPVKPYFTRFLRVLIFCLGASKIVILKENGVVNGVVK